MCFKGKVLWEKNKRCNNSNVSTIRSFTAVRREIVLTLANFMEARMPDSHFEELEVLRQLNVNASDDELKRCHRVICPDHKLTDFISSYREASSESTLTALNLRECLKKCSSVAEWKPLSTSLARLIAAKPHSADVERLISSYNLLKTSDRSSLAPETLRAFLMVRYNMPSLNQWDPNPAVRHWINSKNRRSNQHPDKSLDQSYFHGIF